MGTKQLQIMVDAKNNASPILKQVSGSLADIDKHAGNAAQGLKGLALAGGVAGLATLAVTAGQAVFELGELGAEAKRLETSFGGLASGVGENSIKMLEAMREAARGTIQDTDLMLAANKAMLLGVADSTEEMVGLLEVAAARGKAMGLTTAEAFSNIVTGIGTMQKDVLDNLGITIDLVSVYGEYADGLNKTAQSLTDTEKRQAILNETMRLSKDIVAANQATGPDDADKIERGATAWANLWKEIGKNQAGMVAQTAEEFAFAAEALTHFASEAGRVEGQLDAARHKLEYFQNAAKASGMVSDELARILAAGGNEVAQLQAKLILLTGGLEASSGGTAELRGEFQMLGPAAVTAGDGLTALELKAANLARTVSILTAESDAARAALASIESGAVGKLESAAMGAVGAGAMSASEAARIYGPAEEKLKAQLKVLEQLGYSQDDLNFKAEELSRNLGLPFTNATEAAREAEREARKYASSLAGGGGSVTDAVAEAEAAFESLRGQVAGVLQGALNVGVGVDPDELLERMGMPRADAINENARRLADIAANGLKGQDWLGEFKREAPSIWDAIRIASNPQEEAAHLLKDFQDGLRPDLIDRGMAKDLVRRMLMGEQSMAQLAQELAGELSSELGVPLASAMSAAKGALGVGGGGTEAAQSFADNAVAGVTESDAGGAIVDTTIAQMRSRYGLLGAAARDAGKLWGSEFLSVVGENVPSQLINILVDLTTPGIMAKFQQQGSLTGSAS